MTTELDGKRIDVYLEKDAFSRLSDDSFLSDFRQLMENNLLKSSVFQRPEFIVGWFTSKRLEYLPIIVAEYHGKKLTALMCLASDIDLIQTPNRKTKIVGAGEYDAEYQGWLCSHDKHLDFLESALKRLFSIFPNAQLSLRFFLDDAIATKIKNNPTLKKWITVQDFKRPIADLQTPAFDKILRKRHLKAKINRFNRAGTAELEVIRTRERLLDVLPQVMLLYDFRQGAIFNKYPSVKFLNENPLFVELMDSGIMHFSVLKLQGEITSCIVCYHCEKWIHLAGMITYSPFFARLSPGLVHIYLLSEKLRTEGFEFFDLTPGYDDYKDKFSTSNDVVFELTFSPDKISKISKKTKIAFQNFLIRKGIRPMSFDLGIKKKKYLLGEKTKGIIRLLGGLISGSQHVENIDMVTFRKNSIQDLFNYKEEGMLTKWEFLEDAFSKIEGGGQFITATLDETLLSCIWLFEPKNTKQADNEFSAETETPIPDLEASYFSKSVLSYKREIIEKALKIPENDLSDADHDFKH
jgi:hypothetical protein